MLEKELKKLFNLFRANKNDAYKYVISRNDCVYSKGMNCIIKVIEPEKNEIETLGISGDGFYDIGFQTDHFYKFEDPQESSIELCLNYKEIDRMIDVENTAGAIGENLENLYCALADNSIPYPYLAYDKILKKIADDTLFSIFEYPKYYTVIYKNKIAGYRVEILTFSLPI